ncbi:MAG: MotA/TolQ/ExbB proton channel family protein [Phycisphaerales bacterium]|nr:MotA/TolQ/ExbB proton channel family protein [Phycisphaerales bacterium]
MLWPWFEAGGIMMWPLLVCSILLTGVLIERLWTIGILHLLIGWKLTPEQLKAHQRVLPFFAEVPPALGLLGTVLGVVQSFHLLDGKINADAIGSGLAVACTTTIYGIGIAVVAAVAGHVLNWLTNHEVPAAGVVAS